MKHFIKRGRWDEAGEYEDRIVPLLKPVTPKPIEPGEAELKRNPRARSARLRIGERVTG